MGIEGSGFRISGVGGVSLDTASRKIRWRVRVQDLKFRVQGFEFRVQGFGFRVSGSRIRFQGFGLRVSGVVHFERLNPMGNHTKMLESYHY